MLAEPMDLRNSDSISQNFVNFMLVHELRLTGGNGLFLCNSSRLFFLRRLYQIFYLHCELTIALLEFAQVLAILFGDNINT